MALIRSNFCSVVVERVALFRIAADNFFKVGAVKGAGLRHTGDECVYICPSVSV